MVGHNGDYGDEDGLIDYLHFETRFTNVFQRENDEHYRVLSAICGDDSILPNGTEPRTKHEIYCGLKVVERMGVDVDAKIYNLPFTISNGRKPADTAFTFRQIELRNIYLVPDYTKERVIREKEHSLNILDALLQNNRIDSTIAQRWAKRISDLDVGERVAGSILHEYGHILTYRAMDQAGIGDQVIEGYKWLADSGYLGNCLRRIVGFGAMNPLIKINFALEQMAEDYRLSHYAKCEKTACPLTHGISFSQDISNPENYLEGVAIMKNLLSLSENRKSIACNNGGKSVKSLNDILPFGELDHCNALALSLAGSLVNVKTDDEIEGMIENDMKWFEINEYAK